MTVSNRYLLIKACGNGFWSDMEHVAGSLLMAEMSDRIPVVYWGPESLYSWEDVWHRDAFSIYYQPVSDAAMEDLENGSFTFYPARWNHANLRAPDEIDLSDLDGISTIFSRTENVLVSSIHTHYCFKRLVRDGYYPSHCFDEDKHREMYRKYFKLQPDIRRRVEQFYNSRMKHRQPIVAVHIRGSDKITEVPNLYQLNDLYPFYIEEYLQAHPGATIFLMTDSQQVLDAYTGMYGDRIVHTECIRTSDESTPIHYMADRDGITKGMEILADTYLALQCDHFIGAFYSNVSFAVRRLRAWPEGAVTLIGESSEWDF